MSHLPEILIVEDNYALRETLADYLLEQGFNLRCVDDGEELNAALAEKICDVLVLDLNLPNEDGLSISKRIRKCKCRQEKPILISRKKPSKTLFDHECSATD